MAQGDDNTGRNLALVGGGAALVWWLLRGGGGFGLGDGRGSGAATGSTPKAKASPAKVRVDGAGVSVDGQPTDIAGAAAIVKERGAAAVQVIGTARTGTTEDLLNALRATGADLSVTGYRHA